MGNWNIAIQGAGCHHNNAPYDVEQLVAKFVSELRAQGHSVEAAYVTAGSSITIASKAADEAAAQWARRDEWQAGLGDKPGG